MPVLLRIDLACCTSPSPHDLIVFLLRCLIRNPASLAALALLLVLEAATVLGRDVALERVASV